MVHGKCPNGKSKRILQILQQRMFGIFIADDTQVFRNLPIDGKVRIVEQDTAICLGMIKVIAFIGEDSLIAEHRETVRKTAGDEELAFIIFA